MRSTLVLQVMEMHMIIIRNQTPHRILNNQKIYLTIKETLPRLMVPTALQIWEVDFVTGIIIHTRSNFKLHFKLYFVISNAADKNNFT